MILLSDYNNPNRNPKSITILSLRPYQFIQPEKEKKRYSWWGRSAEDDDTIHTGKTKGKKGVGGWAEEINESVVLWLLQSFVFFSVFHWFRWHYVHLLPARVFGGGYNNHNALKGERVNPPPRWKIIFKFSQTRHQCQKVLEILFDIITLAMTYVQHKKNSQKV